MLKPSRSIQYQCLHRPRSGKSRRGRGSRSQRLGHRQPCLLVRAFSSRSALTPPRSTPPSPSARRSSSQEASTTLSASLVSPPLTSSALPVSSPNSKAQILPMKISLSSAATPAPRSSRSFLKRATPSKAKSWKTSSTAYNSEVMKL